MIILGIDPGPEQSALVRIDICEHPIIYSHKIINNDCINVFNAPCTNIAIEMIASYGMPVGKSVFETCVWIGRFIEILSGKTIHRITRNEVKNNLCHSSRAKDSNIRQALIDRFGAPGTKKNPGVTYGLKKDEWSALAVATTLYDKLNI